MMDETFDPYHKWLGVPPKDQPPNHYRLLGIELFESDSKVISAAADKGMSYVHDKQGGKKKALAVKIRNEISEARICLLDPEKKAKYDKQLPLRRIASALSLLGNEAGPTAERVQQQNLFQDVVSHHDEVRNIQAEEPNTTITKKRAKRGLLLPIVTCATLLCAALWYWRSSSSSQPEVESVRVSSRKSEIIKSDNTVVAPVKKVRTKQPVRVEPSPRLRQPAKKPRTKLPVRVQPPIRFRQIAQRTVYAGSPLVIPVQVEDAAFWKGKLRYQLGSQLLFNAKIDSTTGIFTWTPERLGTYTISVNVTSMDAKRQLAKTILTIRVIEKIKNLDESESVREKAEPLLTQDSELKLSQPSMKMTLPFAARLFGLKGPNWKIVGNQKLEGRAGHISLPTGHFLSEKPVVASSFKFRFKIKAKWYHAIFLTIDDREYYYSRGHWNNKGEYLSVGGKSIKRKPGPKVKSAKEWMLLSAELSGNTLMFLYDGKKVWRGSIPKNPQGKHLIYFGFGSHETTVGVKDFYLEAR